MKLPFQLLILTAAIGKSMWKRLTEMRQQLLPRMDFTDLQGCLLAYKTTFIRFNKKRLSIFFLVKWRQVLLYLANVAIFIETPSRDIGHVRFIWTLLPKAGVTLKLKHRKFFRSSAIYPGHVFRPMSSETGSRTSNAIYDFKLSTTATELKLVLQLSNVFRRSVPNLAPCCGESERKTPKGPAEKAQTTNSRVDYDYAKPSENVHQAADTSLTLPHWKLYAGLWRLQCASW